MKENIQKTGDASDTVYSTKYQAHYHSLHGALEESIHVFISAGLYHLYRKGYNKVSIFEMGCGTGLNGFLSLIEAKSLHLEIDYHSIESDPISVDLVSELNYSVIFNDEQKYFEKLHLSEWDKLVPITPYFNLHKISGQLESFASLQQYDIIYYDAFAPSAQPQLWEEKIHQKLYNSLLPGGVLVTYCSQGAFRRMLSSLGYQIEKLNGPAKKREMLRATKP